MHLLALDYPLSFLRQTPCYYPHPEPPVSFVQTVGSPRGRTSPQLQPAPCGGHRGQRGLTVVCGPSSARGQWSPTRLFCCFQVSGPEFEDVQRWLDLMVQNWMEGTCSGWEGKTHCGLIFVCAFCMLLLPIWSLAAPEPSPSGEPLWISGSHLKPHLPHRPLLYGPYAHPVLQTHLGPLLPIMAAWSCSD